MLPWKVAVYAHYFSTVVLSLARLHFLAWAGADLLFLEAVPPSSGADSSLLEEGFFLLKKLERAGLSISKVAALCAPKEAGLFSAYVLLSLCFSCSVLVAWDVSYASLTRDLALRFLPSSSSPKTVWNFVFS